MFQIPRGNQARDALSAVVVLIICAVGINQTLQYPARAAEWPLWMWSLLAFLSVILLFNSLRKPIVPASAAAPSTPERRAEKRAKRVRIAINIALVVGFVALVPILGFYTAGAVYLCAHMFYLGIRPVWRIPVVAAGALIVFYGMFEYFLGVLVPHGMVF